MSKDCTIVLPGAVQALVRVTISYPADFVRQHMQANDSGFGQALKRLGGCFPPHKFYRGASVMYGSLVLERSMVFAMFETQTQHMHPMLAAVVPAIGGAVFGTGVQALVSRKVINNHSFLASVRFLRRNWRLSLKSVLPEFARMWLSGTIYMGVYGTLREKHGQETLWDAAAQGIVSNCALWMVAYPLDTIRVRLHTQRTVFAPGLYRGLWLVMVRSIPSCALGMMAYEAVRSKVSYSDE